MYHKLKSHVIPTYKYYMIELWCDCIPDPYSRLFQVSDSETLGWSSIMAYGFVVLASRVFVLRQFVEHLIFVFEKNEIFKT